MILFKRALLILLSLQLALMPSHSIWANQPPEAFQGTDVDLHAHDRGQIIAEGQELENVLINPRVRHSLDRFRILNQTNYDLKKTSQIDLNAISVDIIDNAGRITKSFALREMAEFNSYSLLQDSRFQLSYQGQLFFRYEVPIKNVAAVGDTIVFTENDSVNAETNTTDVFFIDLKSYRMAIGATALPVFHLPIVGQHETFKRSDKNRLQVGGQTVTSEVVHAYSDIQQMAFDITVNMSDPAKLEAIEPQVENFQNYFLKALSLHGESLDMQSQLIVGGEESLKRLAADTQAELHDLKASRKATLSRHHQNVLKTLDKSSADFNKNRAAQKKLVTRIKLLWGSLIAPQPKGAPKIAQSLAFVAAGFREKKASHFAEAMRHVIANPSAQMGLAIGTGLALGGTYPTEVAAFFYQGLDVTRTVLSTVLGTTQGLWSTLKTATDATFAGFNPVRLENAYGGENTPRLMVGLTAIVTTLYMAIGVPHILTNSYYLIKDLSKISWSQHIRQEGSVWQALKNAFIQRQSRVQTAYLKALSDDSKKAAASVEYTEEDNQLVDQIIVDLEQKRQNGFISKWLMKLSKKEAPKAVKIETLGQAVRHFLFSYATLTIAGKAYTGIWNMYFAIRSFIWSPVVTSALVAYSSVWPHVTKGQMPTKYNGGLRSNLSWVSQMFQDRKALRELEIWEDRFQLAEDALSKQALEQSYTALLKYIDKQDVYNKAFENGVPKKISDKSLDDLDHKSRTFFRYYYENLLERSSRKFLEEKAIDPDTLIKNTDRLAQMTDADFKVSDTDAERIVVSVNTSTFYNEAQEVAETRINKDHLLTNLKANLVEAMDADNNKQVRRILVVQKQANKPQAMARAVRAMVASNLVDKPLELMFTFVCMAGITSGLLQPIQEEMFSDNSWFHLSRMVFSNGFIYGVISAVFADIWMKLQMDDLNEGKFENVPTGKDAEGGFFKFWFKQTFKNPENGLWRNQMHNMKIIWANMKAAFTTMFVVNLITLGRFDLDSYIVGYMFAYFTPLSGFALKLEQGFELASSYFAKDFPEKLRAHPRAQEYINKTIGRKRLLFNFFYKSYENVLGYLMLNFQQMSTPEFGSRSFSRVLLGGYTWTELAVKGFRATSDTLGFIPGVEKVMNACEHLISNKYTDFEKIAPKEK